MILGAERITGIADLQPKPFRYVLKVVDDTDIIVMAN